MSLSFVRSVGRSVVRSFAVVVVGCRSFSSHSAFRLRCTSLPHCTHPLHSTETNFDLSLHTRSVHTYKHTTHHTSFLFHSSTPLLSFVWTADDTDADTEPTTKELVRGARE